MIHGMRRRELCGEQNMQYNCIERTIELSNLDYLVRLWIDETDGQMIDEEYIVSTIRKSLELKDKAEIRDYLAKNVEHINAVQVTSSYPFKGYKSGTVGYTTSFNDDIHG
jgi:hypothetical protein